MLAVEFFHVDCALTLRRRYVLFALGLATATYTSQMAADRSRDRNRNRAARASHE